MTAVMVFLRIAGKTIAANWKAIAVGLLIGACVWIWCDWRGQAAEIAALEYQLKIERTITMQWRDISRLQSAKAIEAARLRDEFEQRLADELAKPPKEVIKWKTIETTVPGVIDAAPDCGSAVRDIGRLLKGGGQ